VHTARVPSPAWVGVAVAVISELWALSANFLEGNSFNFFVYWLRNCQHSTVNFCPLFPPATVSGPDFQL